MRHPVQKVQSLPSYLYHLTLSGPQKRWYRRHILGPKPVS